MTTVSTNSRMEVKPKLTNVPAPFNTAGPLCTPSPADQPAKPAQAQDLQKSGPGAHAGSGLRLDIPVLLGERKGKQTSLSARYILGIIIAKVGYGRWGYLSEETMRREARCSLWLVKKAKQQLEAAGLLDINRRGKCYRYHVPEWVKHLPKIWVKPSMVCDDEFSILQVVWVSYVKFRQGQNDATWFKLQEFADDLGVSYHTAARAANWSATLGYVQKRHRPWRRPSTNAYRLTYQGREATGVFELKSARPKARALGQTINEGGYSYANLLRKGSLSSQLNSGFSPERDQASFEYLIQLKTNRFVAKSAVIDWRCDPESLRNMYINTLCKWAEQLQDARKLGLPPPRFNQAGYNLGGLNNARREGHGIPLSKPAKAFMATEQGKVTIATGGRMAESEFEQRKKEQIRRLFISPAESITPYTELESALIAQKRDKEAEAKHLAAVLAATRSRSWRYQKYANLGHKLHISIGFDK